MRTVIVLCVLIVLVHLSGAAALAHAESDKPAGVDLLLDLLHAKGLVTDEEGAAIRQQEGKSGSRTDIKALVELLRSKGSISDSEAQTLLKKLAASPSGDEEAADTEEAAKEKPIQASPDIDADMMRAQLHMVLVKQGVLGEDEEAQIAERIGRKWSKAEENDVIADPDFEIEYHRTTLPKEGLLSDVDNLVTVGLLAPDEAERIKARFLRKYSLERVADEIDANLQKSLTSQVEQKIVPMPDWARRFKLGGELRLRYEGDYFASDNGIIENPAYPASSANPALNSTVNRQRFQFRARLNATAKVNDEIDAVLGLASGSASNPSTETSTFGDFMNRQSFLLDLAYLQWSPSPNLKVWGGKFPNPWVCSEMVWAPSLTFDGAAFTVTPKLSKTVSLFLTGGAFPVQEVELSSHDKWLYAGQAGVQYQQDKKLTATLGAAYYFFDNMNGIQTNNPGSGTTNWTAPQFVQKGNTMMSVDPSLGLSGPQAYAAKFHELNVTGRLDLGFWDPVRVVFLGDYVKNLGFNLNQVAAVANSTNVQNETVGFETGVLVGYPVITQFGQWNVSMYYRYLEADAIVDAFNDPDLHLGGTNDKGWIAGLNYGLGKNTWLTARWLTADEITGPKFAIDVLQVDINVRF